MPAKVLASPNISRRKRREAWILCVVLFAVLLPFLPKALLQFDIHVLDEALKDVWGHWRYDEDWATLPPLPRNIDYGWLQHAGRPVLIGHALGEASLEGENTLPALRRSAERGLRLLEVDVWQDAQGLLRCHHGPQPPGPFASGDCTLDDALQTAAALDVWLVLDLKTDFALTGTSIVQRFMHDPAASRLVFQLYKPADVILFQAWVSQLPLPGPIVTAYQARRSLGHLARHSARIGVRALTVPLYRLPALGPALRPLDLTVLTHPVHDCEAVRQARAYDAGLYLQSRLITPQTGACIQ